VIFQFAIAIILIISVIVISRQLNYMQSMDLGFSQKQRLIIPFQSQEARRNFTAFNNELKKLKDVTAVTGCVSYPSLTIASDIAVYKSGQDMKSAKLLKVNQVDEDFFKVMDIPLLTGRQLRPSDTSRQVIVNEKALKVLGIDKDKAAGTHLYFDFEGNHMDYEIVGVTKDYNYSSLKEQVQPLMVFYTSQPSNMIVATTSDNYQSLLSDIGVIWKKIIAGTPFEYSFLDEEIQRQYTEEATLRKISDSFTILAILISCLGLFGLAMFTAQQRIKEIGVRKVLGASVTGIVSMLSKDFLKLVFISIFVATPIAWWAMNKWLQDFAYKINISLWVFVLAGTVALLIALITISFQAIRAALANPVKSLRTE